MKDKQPLTQKELELTDAYFRAANYLSVGQIYLLNNPLLKVPLQIEHVKLRLLGHWGTTPGLNFIYIHCNGLIKNHNLNMLFLAGPGHRGPAAGVPIARPGAAGLPGAGSPERRGPGSGDGRGGARVRLQAWDLTRGHLKRQQRGQRCQPTTTNVEPAGTASNSSSPSVRGPGASARPLADSNCVGS